MSEQQWNDEEFCKNYKNTWEISLSEVHYGWLAPGEMTLKLLQKEKVADAKVLDVGCGLGQNLVALSKKGAQGYGLDISNSMLDKAKEIISSQKL